MNFFSVRHYISLLFFSINLFAQVPNGDFESWSGSEPTGWWTNNIIDNLITQSTDSHGGNYAVRGDNIMIQTTILQPLLISGEIGGHGFPVSARHANLTGYYKLNSVGGDNLSIVVSMFRNGQTNAVGGSQFFGNSVYTQLTVPIFYSNGETPDSCQIAITIGNNSGPVNLGSYFLLDDLVFSGISTSVDNDSRLPKEYSLEQNFPNPFNPSTIIRYNIAQHSHVLLKIYDILGNNLSTPVDEEQQAGRYEVTLEASQLPSGVYFYSLAAGDFVEIKKMLLLK